MGYLWDPDKEREAEARERKRQRQSDREKGIRTEKASIVHDAKTGRTTRRPERRYRVHDGTQKRRFRTGRRND